MKAALGVDRILACSDPLPRFDCTGALLKPAHGGIIYRALNAAYGGRTRPRRIMLLPDGRVFNERTASKIVGAERGAAGALKLLDQAGAPARMSHEPGDRYLARLRSSGFLRIASHPGNLVWTWGTPPAFHQPRPDSAHA